MIIKNGGNNMRNTISFFIAAAVIILSINPALAFGDPANSPNANATVYNTFQSEREGLRDNVNQISQDAKDARAYVVEKTARVKNSVSRTATVAGSMVERATSGDIKERISERIESGVSEVKNGCENFKSQVGPAVKEGVSRFKQSVSNGVENTTANIKRKIHPIGYSVRSVVDRAGSAVGQAIDNVLNR